MIQECLSGLHPYLPLEKNKLNNSDFSYEYTYNLSLNKVSALLDHLEMFNKLEDTNLIITGDHTKTENKNFNIFFKIIFYQQELKCQSYLFHQQIYPQKNLIF